MIDTHCHLYVKAFRNDIGEVIARAGAEGVERFLLPAIDRTEHEAMLELEQRFPGRCLAMMGVHPCSVDAGFREELEAARSWFDKRDFIAVGEIGLDYHWDLTYKAEQQEAFRIQVQWAVDRGLPSVIHSRKSTADCIRILREFPAGVPRGVFHCFSDGLEVAKEVLDLGFYLGIGGVVTYKNSGLDAVVRTVPLEALVLETDAPYLSPVPFRGKRNESGYLKYVAACIAGIKGCSVEEVDRVTTANAQKIFGIL